jgi:hypothetical protein
MWSNGGEMKVRLVDLFRLLIRENFLIENFQKIFSLNTRLEFSLIPQSMNPTNSDSRSKSVDLQDNADSADLQLHLSQQQRGDDDAILINYEHYHSFSELNNDEDSCTEQTSKMSHQ